MSIVRSYTNNFEIIDRTEELLSIPLQWDIINRLGIFGATQGVTTNTVSFEDIIENTAVIDDPRPGCRTGIDVTDADQAIPSAPAETASAMSSAHMSAPSPLARG